MPDGATAKFEGLGRKKRSADDVYPAADGFQRVSTTLQVLIPGEVPHNAGAVIPGQTFYKLPSESLDKEDFCISNINQILKRD